MAVMQSPHQSALILLTYKHSYADICLYRLGGCSQTKSQVANQTRNNSWHVDDEVLTCSSIIGISAGFTRSPETLTDAL